MSKSDSKSETEKNLYIPDADSEKFQEYNELNFLVIGCFQVGKSALINATFLQGEKEKAKEGFDFKPCTAEPKRYPIEVDNMKINIFDTPGLQDGEHDDSKYISMVEKVCPKVNLVIYCTRMGDPIRECEVKALKSLIDAYGQDIFNHFLIPLTFANSVMPPHSKENKIVKEHFEMILKEKKARLSECFEKLQFKHFKTLIEPHIHPVGCLAELKLPTLDNWYVNFWNGCLSACMPGDIKLQTSQWWKWNPYLKNAAVIGAIAGGTAGLVYGKPLLSAIACLVYASANGLPFMKSLTWDNTTKEESKERSETKKEESKKNK